MCFYNLERPRCLHGGKWVYLGPCASEYRPGETCGAKNLYQEIVNQKETCKDCKRLEKKEKKKAEKGKMERQGGDSKSAKSGASHGARIVMSEEAIEK